MELVRAMWIDNSLTDLQLASLDTSTVQTFSQINLAMGDSAVVNDRAVNLMSTEHGEEEYFIQLSTLFQIQLATGSPPVIADLLNLVFFRAFTPVRSIPMLRLGDRNRPDLKSAKDRLKDPLVKRNPDQYVTFASANGPPQFAVSSSLSVVRRCRMWKDTSQDGEYECVFGDR